MIIAIKESEKELQIINTKKKFRTECVKQFIGKENYPEFIRLNKEGTISIGIDDEGLLKDLSENFYIETSHPKYPIQKIVGTAVFVRTKYVNVFRNSIYDYEVTDLTDEDIEIIKKHILESNYQQHLKREFKEYGADSFYVSIIK